MTQDDPLNLEGEEGKKSTRAQSEISNNTSNYAIWVNSTSNSIEITWGEAKCYFNCFTSAIDALIAQVTRAISC